MSVGLKELLAWDLVQVTHTLGDRRDFFQAPHDPWDVIRIVVEGRKRRRSNPDFVVEDRTRQLPALERVLHTALAINFGMLIVAFAPTLEQWWLQPTGIVRTSYGAYSWLFSLFAVGVVGWSIRNALAVLRLRRPP